MTIDVSTFLNDPAVNTQVQFVTELGNIDLELFDQEKPISVANFLNYVRDGRYDTTIIHRAVTEGISVVQGGGYAPPTFEHIDTDDQIQNEGPVAPVRNNVRGTIAMARTSEPNSATSEWFVNTADNPDLDPGGPQGVGYAVFGQVINDTLSVVDAIQALPTFAFGNPQTSPFQTLPLRNYTQTDFNQGRDPTDENFVSVQASTLPKLTLSVSSTDSGTVATTLNGNELTLQYGSTLGPADITIMGMDAQGGVVSETFTATVTEPLDLAVTLGGAPGAPQSVTFTDTDGTVGVISVKGPGTATVTLDGTALTQQTVKKTIAITGAVSSNSIAITGSSAATAVTITGKGGDGVLNLGGLTSDSPLKSLAAKVANLTGTLSFGGTIGKVDLGSAASGTISIGGQSLDRPATITFAGTATGTTINSNTPLKSVTAAAFLAAGSTKGSINTSIVGTITSKGDFAQDVSLGGPLSRVNIAGNLTGAISALAIGSVTVKGAMANGSITATRAFSAAEKPLGKVTIAGEVSESVISANGNVVSISAGSVRTSTIFAGINSSASATEVPSEAGDFASPATIGSVTIKTTTSDTIIGAANIGRVSLGEVNTSNDGAELGVGGDRIASVAGTISGARFGLKKLDEPQDVTDQTSGLTLGDFKVVVI